MHLQQECWREKKGRYNSLINQKYIKYHILFICIPNNKIKIPYRMDLLSRLFFKIFKNGMENNCAPQKILIFIIFTVI